MVQTGDLIIYAIRGKYDLSMEYRYVGLSSRGTSRFKEHHRESSSPLDSRYGLPKSRWMRKVRYLVEFDILEECHTIDELKLNEMKWIHILKSRGHRLLNLTDGGDGTFGWSPDEGWRQHRSKLMSGTGNPMYGRSGELSPNYGVKKSQAFKDNLSSKRTAELNPFHGKVHTEETLSKISDKLIGDKNPASKLSNTDVAEIHRRRNAGEHALNLATEYGVHRDTIDRAYKRAMRLGLI